MATISSRSALRAIKPGDVIDYRRWRHGSKGHRKGCVRLCSCGEKGLETKLKFVHIVKFLGWAWQIDDSCWKGTP